ncbi:MAG: acyl carrier protein [Myxococcota bacterium]|nr:acyl carrier protein [Myxococcota bacterium]
MQTPDTLEYRILQMVSDCSAVPPKNIELDHHLFVDLGMDSVSAMELIGMLDEEFDLAIEIEETVDIKTVRQVLELALARTGHA